MKQRTRSEAPASRWQRFPFRSEHGWLNLLLLAIPIAVGLKLAAASGLALFIASAIGIIPLAGILGEATDQMAAHTGPTVGGLLNATFGNATELIIALFALHAGHAEVVKASLSGSIIGNLLLVLGLSAVVGGIKHPHLNFSRVNANANTTMLFLASVALLMPAVYEAAVVGSFRHPNLPDLQDLSLWASGVLIAVYALSFVFMMRTHKNLFHIQGESIQPTMSKRTALMVLAVATLLIAGMSELLVGEIDEVTRQLGWTELFVGVIVVAIVGNAAEHSTAVLMASRNKMDIALTIAVGSSTQIALFVAPALVFASLLLGHRMSLVFNPFEIAAIVLSVLIVQMISFDGETNWFEGAMLLAVYFILAVSFYFVPA